MLELLLVKATGRCIVEVTARVDSYPCPLEDADAKAYSARLPFEYEDCAKSRYVP